MKKDQVSEILKAKRTNEYCKFNENVFDSASKLEDSLSVFITNADSNLSTNELLNQMKEIVVYNKNPMDTLNMLHGIRRFDDATFVHSLNVAILCHMFGEWLELPESELDILTLSGLLHDVGKLKIPEKIIKKPGSLTEKEFNTIKNHPKRGYKLLLKLPIDKRIKNAALMHHERLDGSGYPGGRKGEDIDYFAKIVAIADIYDALTSARVYRGPICPYQVMDMIIQEGPEKYDNDLLTVFFEKIADIYLQSEVLLSNGKRARVVENNKENPSRPVVLTGHRRINLVDFKDIYIQKILSDLSYF